MKKQKPNGHDLEIEKLKLRAERGAYFDPNLPEEVEDDFISSIKAFEEAAERKETKKVSDVLGNPSFQPVDELIDEELPSAIENLLDVYEEHQMSIDTIYKVENRDFYRFLTEDLPVYEMNVINIPGSFTCFTYEDWYRNDVEDIKQTSREFLDMLFDRSFQFMHFHLAKTCVLDGEEMDDKVFCTRLESHLANLSSLQMDKLDLGEPAMNETSANIDALVSYNLTSGEGMDDSQREKVILTFEESFGYWSIRQVEIAGLGVR